MIVKKTTGPRLGVQYSDRWQEWVVRDNEAFETEKDAMSRRDRINDCIYMAEKFAKVIKSYDLCECCICRDYFHADDMESCNGGESKVCNTKECQQEVLRLNAEAKADREYIDHLWRTR